MPRLSYVAADVDGLGRWDRLCSDNPAREVNSDDCSEQRVQIQPHVDTMTDASKAGVDPGTKFGLCCAGNSARTAVYTGPVRGRARPVVHEDRGCTPRRARGWRTATNGDRLDTRADCIVSRYVREVDEAVVGRLRVEDLAALEGREPELAHGEVLLCLLHVAGTPGPPCDGGQRPIGCAVAGR